jgi:hypothetical protein
LPLAAWLQGFAAGGYRELPVSQHTAMSRTAAAAALLLWTAGVPVLAMGLALERPAWTAAGALALAVAVAVLAASAARALVRLSRAAEGG